MLTEGPVALQPLADGNAPVLASLANNKNVWNNLRDYIPYPYSIASIADAQSFIDSTKGQNPQLSFEIYYRKELCGVNSLVPQQDV